MAAKIDCTSRTEKEGKLAKSVETYDRLSKASWVAAATGIQGLACLSRRAATDRRDWLTVFEVCLSCM